MLHKKHVEATWKGGNHLSIRPWTQGNQEKPVSRWQGKTRKDEARYALFHISCYLCCSVVICVVLCIVCV